MPKRLLSIVIILLAMSGLVAVYASPLGQQTSAPQLRIVFVSNRNGDKNKEIYTIPADGSIEPTRLTNDPANDFDPSWSPDGAHIVFTSDRTGIQRLYVMDQNGAAVRPLIPDNLETDDTSARWSPDGKLIAFISNRAGIGWDLYTVDSDGQNVTQITDTGAIKGGPAWSPDSSQIVFWEQQKGGTILLFKIDLATKRIQRLTLDGPHDGAPIWNSDGSFIYFDSDRDGTWGVYRMGANGETPTRLTLPNINSGRAALSPDNQQLIFVSDREESDELYIINLSGNTLESGLTRLTKNLDSDYAPSWQPALPESGPSVVIAPVVAATPTPPIAAVAVGQSANGVDVSPVPMETFLVDSGIRTWHDQNWKGNGRRIAVIDTAFGGITDFKSKTGTNIILPPEASEGDYNNSTNHHGTEALEIIHAIAPEAQLYACRYAGTLEGLSTCTDWLIDKEQVHIINHSVGIPVLPLDGNGKWAQLVDDAFSRNVIWINSSGNFRRSFLRNLFYDPDGNNVHEFFINQQRDELLRVDTVPYRGNIILAWLQPSDIYLPRNSQGQQEKIDFDLEVVSLADPSKILASSSNSQRTEPIDPDPQKHDEGGTLIYWDKPSNPDSPSSEFVYVDAQEPFGIRVKNAGLPFQTDVELALVAEYAQITDENVTQTVISPGDARYSITVGATRGGSNQLAIYSSYGADSEDYVKPDLVAPGEFILPISGETFVGTSAAAPVMAGITALYWQSQLQGGNRLADVIYPELLKLVVPPPQPVGYGNGIVRLPPPTRSNVTSDSSSPPTAKTVWPPPPITVIQPNQCTGAIPSRIAIGTRAYANFNLGLFVRADPNPQGSVLTKLLLGDSFTVVDGPECNSLINWWKIQLDDGGFGWVGEGGDYYLVAPINLKRAELPTVYTPDCPLAAPTQLSIGQRAIVSEAARGGVFFFRAEQAKYQIAGIEPGPEVHILGGPVCEGKQNLLRWYVRMIDGPWAGSEGWIAESGTRERILVPK